VLGVAARQPAVAQLVVNGWVRVVTIDPVSRALHIFRNGAFGPWIPPEGTVLPEVPDSRSHWRNHLHNLPSVAVRRILDPQVSPNGSAR
jgi:hypothetical protein